MRKQEMSLRQLQQRTLIVERLFDAGWRPSSNEHEMFDEGLWVQCEAVMEYSGPEVSLEMFYRADQDAFYLSMNMPDESSIELKMDIDDHLDNLLGVLTSFQDKLTKANYKDYIRALMGVCKNLYVMNKEEIFVPLTDNNSP